MPSMAEGFEISRRPAWPHQELVKLDRDPGPGSSDIAAVTSRVANEDLTWVERSIASWRMHTRAAPQATITGRRVQRQKFLQPPFASLDF
jgi:hypothetical protein